MGLIINLQLPANRLGLLESNHELQLAFAHFDLDKEDIANSSQR